MAAKRMNAVRAELSNGRAGGTAYDECGDDGLRMLPKT
jgi:hypothetical protein